MCKLVSFEVAKLAKKLNINLESQVGYSPDGEELNSSWKFLSNVPTSIPRPTQESLVDFLLEKYGLFIGVELLFNEWGRYNPFVLKKSVSGASIPAVQIIAVKDNKQDALEVGLLTGLDYVQNYL